MTLDQEALCTFTRSEVAATLGVSLLTITNWVNKGVIKPPAYCKRGPRWIKFNLDEIRNQVTNTSIGNATN